MCVCARVPQRKAGIRRLRQVRGFIRDDLDDDNIIPANIESGRHTATSITTASVPDDDDRWSTDETAHNDGDSEIVATISCSAVDHADIDNDRSTDNFLSRKWLHSAGINERQHANTTHARTHTHTHTQTNKQQQKNLQ